MILAYTVGAEYSNNSCLDAGEAENQVTAQTRRLDASTVLKDERIPGEFLFFSPGWKAKRTGGGWQ